jgi:hypothetical protein
MTVELLRKASTGFSKRTLRYGLIIPPEWWGCVIGLAIGGVSFIMDASGIVNMDMTYAAPGTPMPAADAGSIISERSLFRKWARKSAG